MRCRWPALRHVDVEPGSTVVCLISGGNNDVSRYGEILERSLVHLGLKHYFLVDFPQEPGALRRFLDEVLGPDDDITLFEYVKRNNRETGPALVGIELGSADGAAVAARADGGLAHARRAARAGFAGVPLPDLAGTRLGCHGRAVRDDDPGAGGPAGRARLRGDPVEPDDRRPGAALDRRRGGATVAATGFEEVTALFQGSKLHEFEQRQSALMHREDAGDAAPPRVRVDIDANTVVLRGGNG